jgi:hypothetical protein
MPYKKKKPVKIVEGPKSFVADIIQERDRKKKIKEKIFEDKNPKNLNNKNKSKNKK